MNLRELEDHETVLLHDLDSDPEVMKYLSGGNPSSWETCQEATSKIRSYYEKYHHKFGIWIAEERSSREFIGWFLLRPDKSKPEDLENPELGYRLKKKFWGRGYATEGSQALLQKAFLEFQCKSVFAVTLTSNEASQAVMKKLGMDYICQFNQQECCDPNGDTSVVQYVVSKQKWSKQNL